MVNTQLRTDVDDIGTLGFLECEQDYETFRRLLEPALCWLDSSAGVRCVWATMNFDIWHSYRLMDTWLRRTGLLRRTPQPALAPRILRTVRVFRRETLGQCDDQRRLPTEPRAWIRTPLQGSRGRGLPR